MALRWDGPRRRSITGVDISISKKPLSAPYCVFALNIFALSALTEYLLEGIGPFLRYAFADPPVYLAIRPLYGRAPFGDDFGNLGSAPLQALYSAIYARIGEGFLSIYRPLTDVR